MSWLMNRRRSGCLGGAEVDDGGRKILGEASYRRPSLVRASCAHGRDDQRLGVFVGIDGDPASVGPTAF